MYVNPMSPAMSLRTAPTQFGSRPRGANDPDLDDDIDAQGRPIRKLPVRGDVVGPPADYVFPGAGRFSPRIDPDDGEDDE